MSEGDTDHAVISEDDGVITVTITRPDKLGAISPAVTGTLWQAVEQLGDRPDLRVMVITGTGRYFSAGLDLKVGHGGRVPGPEATGRGPSRRHGRPGAHVSYRPRGAGLGAASRAASSARRRRADWRKLAISEMSQPFNAIRATSASAGTRRFRTNRSSVSSNWFSVSASSAITYLY